MPNVDFYIIEQDAPQSRYLLTCKLVAKAYAAAQNVYIYCQNAEQAKQLDDLLWSFDDISFIPHALISIQLDKAPAILLGWTAGPSSHNDILINLNENLPDNLDHYQRIIEVVSQDPQCKKACREHYKTYQERKFPLKSHNV